MPVKTFARGFCPVMPGFLMLCLLLLSSCVTDQKAASINLDRNEAAPSVTVSSDTGVENVKQRALSDICYDAINGDARAQYQVGRFYLDARSDPALLPKDETARPRARANYTALAMIWFDKAIIGGEKDASGPRRSLGAEIDSEVFQIYQTLSHMKDAVPCELHEINNPFFNIKPL